VERRNVLIRRLLPPATAVFIIAKNDLERHAHTLSGDAGADLRSQAGGATRNRII